MPYNFVGPWTCQLGQMTVGLRIVWNTALMSRRLLSFLMLDSVAIHVTAWLHCVCRDHWTLLGWMAALDSAAVCLPALRPLRYQCRHRAVAHSSPILWPVEDRLPLWGLFVRWVTWERAHSFIYSWPALCDKVLCSFHKCTQGLFAPHQCMIQHFKV